MKFVDKVDHGLVGGVQLYEPGHEVRIGDDGHQLYPDTHDTARGGHRRPEVGQEGTKVMESLKAS